MRDAASALILAAVEGAALTPDEERFFREESPAGVTLFKRNIPQHYPDVLQLNRALQGCRGASDPAMIIAIDQEGGRVSRIGHPFPNLGPAMNIANKKDDADSRKVITDYGELVGNELKKIGINVNFAPVLDVLTEPSNVAIGDRCFGTHVDQVIKRAAAYLSGLQRAGILGCLKHFPGQGDAKVDTHLGKALIDLSLQTLISRELVPFKALMPDAKMVMISHSIYPILCDKEASRSEIIILNWLRSRLGFDGVVVSDDMNMGALPQDIADWKLALIESVIAGCDLLLVCRHLDRCYAAVDALRREAARSKAFSTRLQFAASRVVKARTLLPL